MHLPPKGLANKQATVSKMNSFLYLHPLKPQSPYAPLSHCPTMKRLPTNALCLLRLLLKYNKATTTATGVNKQPAHTHTNSPLPLPLTDWLTDWLSEWLSLASFFITCSSLTSPSSSSSSSLSPWALGYWVFAYSSKRMPCTSLESGVKYSRRQQKLQFWPQQTSNTLRGIVYVELLN